MNFRTEYNPEKSKLILSPLNPVVMSGSCFSHNMGERMRQHLWNAVNVTGTLFNPLSIEMALRLMVLSDSGEKEFEKTLFSDKDGYRSWIFDSKFAFSDREECLENFRRRAEVVRITLKKGETLIVTFGTAYCYFLKSSGIPVGNCHKQPSDLFLRRKLTVEEITEHWVNLYEALKSLFPELKIIFTVSPVRHLKDGFEGNARSKAILISAVEQLCDKIENSEYFPSYEIIMDDLRDYRFYADDLVHPSSLAMDYLWEKFQDKFIKKEDQNLLSEGLKIVKGIRHKYLGNFSKSNLLITKEMERLENLKKNYLELKEKNPELLRFDYPFEEDPGF